jgi:hypothetical protein
MDDPESEVSCSDGEPLDTDENVLDILYQLPKSGNLDD